MAWVILWSPGYCSITAVSPFTPSRPQSDCLHFFLFCFYRLFLFFLNFPEDKTKHDTQKRNVNSRKKKCKPVTRHCEKKEKKKRTRIRVCGRLFEGARLRVWLLFSNNRQAMPNSWKIKGFFFSSSSFFLEVVCLVNDVLPRVRCGRTIGLPAYDFFFSLSLSTCIAHNVVLLFYLEVFLAGCTVLSLLWFFFIYTIITYVLILHWNISYRFE